MKSKGPGKIVLGLPALLTTCLLLAVIAIPIAPGPGVPLYQSRAQAAQQADIIDLLALDMNPTGNTVADPPSGNVEETSLGTIERCVEVNHPATFDFDAVVQGYPPDTHSLVAYDITLTLPAGLELTNSVSGDIAVLGRTLLSADPQSGPSFFAQVDAPNYGVGAPLAGPASYDAAVLDFGPGPTADESIDGEENSDGFLIRYSIQTTAAGPAELPLTLSTNSNFVSDDLGGLTITKVQNGIVAVGKSCAGLTPPPGPTDTGTTDNGTQDQTPGDGTPSTSDSGTPTTPDNGLPSTGTDGTPSTDTDGTPSTGTDGTPAPGTEGAAGGGDQTADMDESDGGIGTAGWVAIGVGIAAALAALAAAAWMIRARARRGI